jgi:hypothetical protein
MVSKILICAIIALVLVPASVMAAGSGGKNAGGVSGQGICLQDGQNCVNPGGQAGTGIQAQHQYFGQATGGSGIQGTMQGARFQGNGQGDMLRNQTHLMTRLYDGSCGNCPVTQ